MSPNRTSALLLCAAFGLVGTAVAQDKVEEAGEAAAESAEGATEKADDATDKIEGIVEERAEEEERDGEPAGFDVGEASYNVADCEPANDEEDAEGGVQADDEADDPDADGEVVEKDMDECEEVVK